MTTLGMIAVLLGTVGFVLGCLVMDEPEACFGVWGFFALVILGLFYWWQMLAIAASLGAVGLLGFVCYRLTPEAREQRELKRLERKIAYLEKRAVLDRRLEELLEG